MKVFVSSVSAEFEEFRLAAREAIKEAGHEPIMFEDFPAQAQSPRVVCLDAVRGCEALILLAGKHYGQPTDAGISPVEEEYWQARFGIKPVAIFAQTLTDGERDTHLKQFLHRIGGWESGHFRSSFATTEELKVAIGNSLSQDLSGAVDHSFEESYEGLHEWLTALRTLLHTHRDPSSYTLPQLGILSRPEKGRLYQQISSSDGVLLVGDAGVGKTGLVNAMSSELFDSGIPVMLLRASAFPRTASSIAVVDDLLPVSTTLPRMLTLIGRVLGACYIVIDQLDTVAGTPWSSALTAFAAHMASQPNVHVLCTSRAYDADANPEIRDLPFERFPLDRLDEGQTQSLLRTLGLVDPQTDLVELGRNLLNLSLIADLVTIGEVVSDVHTETALWHRYRESLERREGQPALARAVELAKQVLSSGQSDFAIDISPDNATQKLLSRNLLVEAAGERYRFFHEEVPSYLYSWDASLRRMALPGQSHLIGGGMGMLG